MQLNLWSAHPVNKISYTNIFSFFGNINNIYSVLTMYQAYVPLNFVHVLIHGIPQQPLEKTQFMVSVVQIKKKKKTDAQEIQVVCSKLHR